MKPKYYDEWKFQQALSYSKIDPIASKIKYEEYLKKYPKDYNAYTYYAAILIILGEFENANKVLDYVEKIVEQDTHFINIKTIKYSILKRDILFDRIKILCYQERYNEIYKLYKIHYHEIKAMDMDNVIFYSMIKLGKQKGNKNNIRTYLFRQIVKYEESEFLEHIQKHLTDIDKENNTSNKNIFVAGFPINEVLQEIKKYIPSSKSLYFGFFEDSYIFKYNACGRSNNKLVDYFKVVCFHNTQDIITICPVSESEHLPHIDLNYMINNKDNPKVKRKSQIDKFNQRYQK